MAHKYRKNFNDDYYEDNFRKPREGFRGRVGAFKNKGRSRGGRYNSSASRVFENALSGIRHGRYSGDRCDLEELIEQDPLKWFKMSVIFGAQVPKEWISSKLREITNEDIPLMNFNIEGKNVVTFLHTKESVVRSIRRLSHNFVDPMGKRLTMNLTSVVEPSIPRLTDWMEEAVKKCLEPRLDFASLTLNLNDFNKDPHLSSVGLYLSLSRHNVSQFVVKLLVENLNELNGLNISNNMLETLASFKPLTEKFKSLKHLDVSFNRLRSEGNLEVLKSLSMLESLNVQGNPFVKTQKVENLGNHLRRRFSSLLKLNGKDLPPRMKFGVAEGSKKAIPDSLLGSFPSDELRIGVLTFLKEYFEKYDSGKRSILLNMYAEDSHLTLSVSPRVASDVYQKIHRYDDATFKISRNLLRVQGDEKRHKLVNFGNLQAVSVLDRLPKTHHFLDSFRVDILYHNEATIFFNVVGVYQEFIDGTSVFRVFNRTMQVNAPSIIKSDNLIVSHASLDVIKKYKDAPVTAVSPPPVANEPSPAVATTSAPAAAAPAAANPEELVNMMVQQSGMNEHFSRQCLTDYNFDFNVAMEAFRALNAANKIPPEAFS